MTNMNDEGSRKWTVNLPEAPSSSSSSSSSSVTRSRSSSPTHSPLADAVEVPDAVEVQSDFPSENSSENSSEPIVTLTQYGDGVAVTVAGPYPQSCELFDQLIEEYATAPGWKSISSRRRSRRRATTHREKRRLTKRGWKIGTSGRRERHGWPLLRPDEFASLSKSARESYMASWQDPRSKQVLLLSQGEPGHEESLDLEKYPFADVDDS